MRRFTKMHGAGNDYVYVDCFTRQVPDDLPELARAISDRHFGVGGDGLILICPSDTADAEMRMFNADGSAAEMCGNGIRCVAKYLYDHDIAKREVLCIESAGKRLELHVTAENGKAKRIRVDMGEPELRSEAIPTTFATDRVVDAPLVIAGRTVHFTGVSMGNPHAVIFVDEATDEWVYQVGPLVERDSHFPHRVNVEFVEVATRHEVTQRTWERGSGETLACGTGASAVCVAGVLTDRTDRQVTVNLLGGALEIEWNADDNHVYMTGPAVEVFSGEWPD